MSASSEWHATIGRIAFHGGFQQPPRGLVLAPLACHHAKTEQCARMIRLEFQYPPVACLRCIELPQFAQRECQFGAECQIGRIAFHGGFQQPPRGLVLAPLACHHAKTEQCARMIRLQFQYPPVGCLRCIELPQFAQRECQFGVACHIGRIAFHGGFQQPPRGLVLAPLACHHAKTEQRARMIRLQFQYPLVARLRCIELPQFAQRVGDV